MAQKIILICIDGTWMASKNQSNVFKFYSMAEESESQVKFYFEGLGTRWFNKVPGGLFGLGIKRQILRAYSAIIDTYSPGDELHLVGFSRGAYAVRALSGLLYFCGVLRRDHKDKVNAAWKHYRSRGRSNACQPGSWSDPCIVALLLCFDTVGSIGIPFTRTYSQGWFPHLYPMPNVRTIRHALAIDEKRAFFKPLLFEERPAGFEE
jgi:uncharacterized protein (DUF2235 family)